MVRVSEGCLRCKATLCRDASGVRLLCVGEGCLRCKATALLPPLVKGYFVKGTAVLLLDLRERTVGEFFVHHASEGCPNLWSSSVVGNRGRMTPPPMPRWHLLDRRMTTKGWGRACLYPPPAQPLVYQPLSSSVVGNRCR
jgi:hypothetical protein